MRTVNELKKLPASELHEAITLEIVNCRKGRETELKASYLERHPEVTEVPDFIIGLNEDLARYFTLGSLQTLLLVAIRDLQQAEEALERAEDQMKEMLKMSL